MDRTPESPEELLNRVSDFSVRDFFPGFDEAPPHCQRLIQLVHTEILQGSLTYRDMQRLMGYLLCVWKNISIEQHGKMVRRYNPKPGYIDQRLPGELIHFGRMMQYLDALYVTVQEFPLFPDSQDRKYEQ